MKVLEKEKAKELRKSGLTYKEILDQLSVSRGSLSYWLRDIMLTDVQKERIYGKNLNIRRKFIEYNKKKHDRAISYKENIVENSRREIIEISKEELKLIGIALYWAEGYKAESAKYVEFVNSDPVMIRLMMKWFRIACNVPDEKFRIKIQIHNEENIKGAIEFWSLNTGIQPEQFMKPYLKTSPTSKRRSGNTLSYGVCHIRISDIALLTKIKGWIDGMRGPIV